MRIRALTVVAVLVVGTAGFLAGQASSEPPPLLCAIPPVAPLFDCPQPSSSSSRTTSQTQTETESSSDEEQARPAAETTTVTTTTTAPAPAPTLAASVPVSRASTTPQYVPNKILVQFKAGTSAAARKALIARIGATIDTTVADIHVTTLLVPPSRRAQALATLAKSPIVVHAERDAVFHLMSMAPDDTFYSRQWGLTVGDFANSLNRPGRAVVVAVVDTGVDAAQPDLKGVVLRGVDLTGSGGTNDTEGHGTAVAGVIAARANNGIGGAGVCAKCKILPIKVTGPNGTADTALVASGIVKAVDKGARVINVSMGAPTTLATLQQAVDYANSKGAIVLAAAGNSGVTTKFYPAAYPNVISVAGSTQRDGLYGWSNRGSWVDVAAPGCNVAPLISGQFGEFCGTSSATPLVAGLAGLIRSSHPHASPAAIRAKVERAAKRIRVNIKFGRIDAGATLAGT